MSGFFVMEDVVGGGIATSGRVADNGWRTDGQCGR